MDDDISNIDNISHTAPYGNKKDTGAGGKRKKRKRHGVFDIHDEYVHDDDDEGGVVGEIDEGGNDAKRDNDDKDDKDKDKGSDGGNAKIDVVA